MNSHDEDSAPPSKTQRKQQMEALQELGEELVALPVERVRKIDIPDVLRDAVREAQRMTRRDDARRRQMQYIGKLMRGVDVAPIHAALEQVRSVSAQQTARLHRLEKLRDDLLADEQVLGQIAARHPGADLQQLRALRRAALREREQNQPPRNYRAIFQWLKEVEEAHDAAATEAAEASAEHDPNADGASPQR